MKTFFELHDKVLKPQLLIILLVELAKQRGVHSDKLLKGTKLFHQDLLMPNLQVSHSQFVKLVENCCKLMPQKDTAFLIGSRLFPNYLGHVGQAILHSPSVANVLKILQCYQQQFFPFLFIRKLKTKEHFYLLFNPAISKESMDYQCFMVELLASLTISILKQRGIPLDSFTFRFPYAKPRHIEQYQAYMPVPISFSCGQKEVIAPFQLKCDLSATTLPLNTANALLCRHNLQQQRYQDHDLTHSVGFLQFVMELLNKGLTDKRDVSLESLASQLDISAATLKRKLSSHGVSYQVLIDAIRQQHAVFMLTEQGMNNECIAHQLNFSDITNFRRSFKRWTGMSPSLYQRSY